MISVASSSVGSRASCQTHAYTAPAVNRFSRMQRATQPGSRSDNAQREECTLKSSEVEQVMDLSHSVTASASIMEFDRIRDYSTQGGHSDFGHGHLSEAVLPTTMGSDSTIRSNGS